MPTVLRFPGFRIVIYPNDHRPAHVHLIGKGQEAIFELHCPQGPVSLRENFGYALHGLNLRQKELANHLSQLCQAWEDIHDHA